MINTPHEVIEITKGMAQKKHTTPFVKLVILGILAGFYIGMGGTFSSLAGAGIGGIAETNPILPKLISGATFPLGLILIILVGGELFTGNNANLIPATMQGEIPKTYFLKNWTIVFIANFIGLIIFDYVFVYHSGIMQSEPYVGYITKLAEYKTQLPWHQVFIRAIGANWLVCLAVWLGLSSRTMLGRLAGLWWPVMAFVVMGFEHSIANMFYIPTGIFHGANVTWSAFFVDNLIPATLGNIIGGAVFVGGIYNFLYGKK